MTSPESEPAPASQEKSSTGEQPTSEISATERKTAEAALLVGTTAIALWRLLAVLWRRRRRRVVAVAATVVALALLVVGVVIVTAAEPTPEDVVAEYLETLQAGDVPAALKHASQAVDYREASRGLLVPEAMDRDWDAEVLRVQDQRADFATVDVSITAEDGTSRNGRFELEHSDHDGGWSIRNPLVQLSVSALPASYAEFNQAVTEDERVWLFPGAYEPYPGLSGRAVLSSPVYVAAPATPDDLGESTRQMSFAPLIEVLDDFETELDEQVRDWIDQCAASTDPSPTDCPFSSADMSGTVRTEDGQYRVEEVQWEPIEYPTLRLDQELEHFALYTAASGQVRLSGEGERIDGDGEVSEFSQVCAIDVGGSGGASGFYAVYTAAGKFDFGNHDPDPPLTC